MPEEWPVFPVARTSQEPALRRAIEPMSRPSSWARPSKSSATSDILAAATRSRRGDGDGAAGILLVAGHEYDDVGGLEGSGGVHGAERRDHHGVAALVVAGAGAL